MSPDNVEIALDRINDCMNINGHSFQLQIFTCRYGGYFVAFLGANVEASYHTSDQFSGSDDNYSITKNHFLQNDWYPMATGNSFQEALDKLAEKIASISQENYSTWKEAVDLASRLFSQKVTDGKLHELRDNWLPNFTEYVDWLKKETYI